MYNKSIMPVNMLIYMIINNCFKMFFITKLIFQIKINLKNKIDEAKINFKTGEYI